MDSYLGSGHHGYYGDSRIHACGLMDGESTAHIDTLMHVTGLRREGTCKKVVEFLH